jgi:hypothetical protein
MSDRDRCDCHDCTMARYQMRFGAQVVPSFWWPAPPPANAIEAERLLRVVGIQQTGGSCTLPGQPQVVK